MTACAASWPCAAVRPSSRWTTAWPPSTAFPPPSTTPGPRWPGCKSGPACWAWLAAATAFFARDRGLPLALQLLIMPGTASQPCMASHRLFASGFLLDAASIAWFFDHYIDRGQRHDWRFAPLEAEDHAGLAPACVVLAECDPLVDEGLAYADMLRAAAVPVQLELYRGVTHDFIKMGRYIPEALTALDACAQALRERLAP